MFVPTAFLDRGNPEAVDLARSATEGQHDKMELLYNYMASDELRSRLGNQSISWHCDRSANSTPNALPLVRIKIF